MIWMGSARMPRASFKTVFPSRCLSLDLAAGVDAGDQACLSMSTSTQLVAG